MSNPRGRAELHVVGDDATAHDHQPQSAVEFLQKLRPAGPWVLTAINPDARNTITRTFVTAEKASDFISEHNGKLNLYYSINPLVRPISKKAKKADIAAAEFVPSDLDPVDGETAEAAKERYTKALADFPLPPTFVVDSGNGLNVAWRLDQAVAPDDFEKVEALSKALMQKFGSVAGTQNVDRILRLPFTTNLPTAAKRKKGRVACQSTLLHFNGVAYPFAALDSAVPKTTGSTEKHRVEAGSNGEGQRKTDTVLDRLPIPDRIRALIRGVDDPEHTYASRSERVYAVLLAMCRGGCTDRQIEQVLLNPELPISAHVLEARNPNPEEYLKRQIASAREAATDPDVAELNETYAAVKVGSNVAVMQMEGDDIVLMKYEAFQQWLANRSIQIGKKRVSLAKYWFEHPQRRQYKGIVFAPGRDVPGYFNFWRGFAVEPRKGDCSKFLAHLKDNVCRGDENLFAWTVGWFAEIVQHPGQKGGTSLVIRGKEGTGKTKVGEVFGSLLGPHYMPVSEQERITGRFNSHMRQLLLLHAEEAFWAGSHQAEGKLKDLVTGKRHLIEFKGKDPVPVDNHIRLLITSNAKWVVPASLEARRFAVLEIGEARMKDGAYFAAIDEEMKNGGREALMHHLLNFHLSKVDMRSIPKTAALFEQKVASLSSEQGWWFDILNRGRLPRGLKVASECPTALLFNDYVEHAQKVGIRRRSLETRLGMFLQQIVPGLRKRGGTYTNADGYKERGLIYDFPSLAQCRESFAKMTQQDIEWPEPTEWLNTHNDDTAVDDM